MLRIQEAHNRAIIAIVGLVLSALAISGLDNTFAIVGLLIVSMVSLTILMTSIAGMYAEAGRLNNRVKHLTLDLEAARRKNEDIRHQLKGQL